jgi:FKBP-type peptidyl-prolyl cis-trans isomerase
MVLRLLRRAAIALTLATAACLGSSGPGEPVPPTDPATVTFAPALGVNLAAMTKTPSGLYYSEVAVGAGRVAATEDSVALNFAGFVSSGEQIARSRVSPPSETRLTVLIAGLREGVVGMRPGGRRKLVLPPYLGFGNIRQSAVEDFPAVPPNSVLVFDVELVRIVGDSTTP